MGQNGGGISTLRKQAFDDDDIFDVSVWNFYLNYDDWNKDSENLFSSFSANEVTVMLPSPPPRQHYWGYLCNEFLLFQLLMVQPEHGGPRGCILLATSIFDEQLGKGSPLVQKSTWGNFICLIKTQKSQQEGFQRVLKTPKKDRNTSPPPVQSFAKAN